VVTLAEILVDPCGAAPRARRAGGGAVELRAGDELALVELRAAQLSGIRIAEHSAA
jgi:hypothetical protein